MSEQPRRRRRQQIIIEEPAESFEENQQEISAQPIQKNKPNLICCPDCGSNISRHAVTCPRCGCPIKLTETKIIVKTSSEFIGLLCAYIIYDENNNEVARLKPGESFVKKLPDKQVRYSVMRSGAFGSAKEMICEPHTINRFSVAVSQSGFGFVVSRVDILDSRD